MSEILIRDIIETDNKALKILVKTTLAEFGAQSTGCSSNDDEVNNMYQVYHQPNNFYFVVEKNNKILGGAGCVTLKEHQNIKACELRKMYFSPQLRGLGIGKKLLDMCIKKAKKLGYNSIQLETMPTMTSAQNLYTKTGFVKKIKNQQSHCNQACDIFMVKQI